MAHIHISLEINAPLPVVFDLARSIDMHMVSTEGTNEKAIDGITSGLIEANQTVTWQAKHLFKIRKFKTIIPAMQPYHYFKDEMLEGDFKKFQHEHFFEEKNGVVLMKDVLHLEAPYGIIGKMVMRLFLKNYIKGFLERRNNIIKQYAESGEWKKILNTNDYK